MNLRATVSTLLFALPALAAKPTADQAKAFVAKTNDDLKRLDVKFSTADWVKNNFITDDTQQIAAWANEDLMAYTSQAIKESVKFKDVKGLDPDTARAISLLRLSAAPLPAPNDAKKREELATLAAKLEGTYGK